MNKTWRNDDGAAAMLTVLLTSLVFIGLCALVVDLGMARDTRRQAQNAADASALAAGNVLYLDSVTNKPGFVNIPRALAAAKSYVDKNLGLTLSAGEWAACSDSNKLPYNDATTPCISFGPDALAPTTVRVKIPTRQVSTPFAQIWGVSTVPVSAAAQIQLRAGGKATCGLCVLGSGNHNLQTGSISVTTANIAINGTITSSSGTVTVDPSMSISLVNPSPGTTFYPSTAVVFKAPMPDPLASLPMPDTSGLSVHAVTNACPGSPGFYDHLTACSATGSTAMAAGLYVLTGSPNMNDNIVANGVTLYFMCGDWHVTHPCALAGENGGSISFNGTSSLSMVAPVAPLANAGISVIADRNNTSTFAFGGNGVSYSGTIYLARGTLSYNGNGSGNVDSLVVIGDFNFAGTNTAWKSTYSEPKNAPIPAGDLHLSE